MGGCSSRPCEAALLHALLGDYFGDVLARRRRYRLEPYHLDMERDFTRQCVNRVGHMVIRLA
jgi:hypothetical protein